MWQSFRSALSIPSHATLSAPARELILCRRTHPDLDGPDRFRMGSTMAKPSRGRRPFSLEVGFEGDEAVETPWGGPTSACCHRSPDHCLRAHKQRLPKERIMRAQHLRVAPPPGDLQVAIYARVSSDQQAERHTIESQLAELKARVGQDGYQIRDDMLFVDNGHSGASLIRPALECLRDLVALSALDVVYVHAPDRLARSYAHQVLLLEEFARADTRVVFLNRP